MHPNFKRQQKVVAASKVVALVAGALLATAGCDRQAGSQSQATGEAPVEVAKPGVVAFRYKVQS